MERNPLLLVNSSAPGNGAQVPILPECDSALQVQAAPKHGTASLSAANSEQQVEFVDTSQKDLTD